MPQVEDEEYCDWIARRAVARASLHLGIEDMTEEALHVLASCLLDYLRRIGSLTAANAEASGRSTSHCNVLDAIRAIELCTSPSAINGSLMTGSDPQNSENENGETSDALGAPNSENETNHSPTKHPINSWKSLAQFCFGVDWDQEGSAVRAAGVGRGIGSKGAAVDENVVSTIEKKGGWSAPFPEEIPLFPIRSRQVQDESFHSTTVSSTAATTANPSGLDNTTTSLDSDADQKMEETDNNQKIAASEIQDDEVDGEAKLWGVLIDSTTETTPLTKSEVSESEAANKRKAKHLPEDPFLPSFYPPLPATAARKVAKVKEGSEAKPATDAEALMSVRAALVVPSGLPTKNVEPKTIVPVARASSAPVSRILEGSMDPAQS